MTSDHTRKCCRSFPTNLIARIAFSESRESLKGRCRRDAIPIGFACDATKRVRSVSPHSGDWIVEHGDDRGHGPNVGHVVENLDAPPPHAGAAIGEAVDKSREAVVRESCPAELRRGDSSGKLAQGLKFATPKPEKLHELLLCGHARIVRRESVPGRPIMPDALAASARRRALWAGVEAGGHLARAASR